MSDTRPCTCHPDDNPPSPCMRKFSLTECKNAEIDELKADLAAALVLLEEARPPTGYEEETEAQKDLARRIEIALKGRT